MVLRLPIQANCSAIGCANVNVLIPVARVKSGDIIIPSLPLSNKQWAQVPLISQYLEIVWFSSCDLSGRVGNRYRLLWWYRGSADLSTATIVRGCGDPSFLGDSLPGVIRTPYTLCVGIPYRDGIHMALDRKVMASSPSLFRSASSQ